MPCKHTTVFSSSNERDNLFTSVRSCHTNPCWKGERFVWTFIQMNALTAILTNLTNLYHLQRRLMGKSTLWCPSNQVHPVKRYILCLKWDTFCGVLFWEYAKVLYSYFLQNGGMKAGTFDSYPSYSAEPYGTKKTKSAKTNKEGKIFHPSPGPKSTPVKSIISLNVNK